MGKGNKGSGNRTGVRKRINPLTGVQETIAGTKAGKKRTREALNSPLRTHDGSAPRKNSGQ